MKLPEEELIRYLATVVHVSKLDGALSSRETELINAIQARIGATQSDLSKASAMAENVSFKITPFSRFALNVQLLEDLIATCLIDGSVDVAEQKPIVEFAILAGITQEQLSIIAKDANAAISSEYAK
jgi:hypothetical protein